MAWLITKYLTTALVVVLVSELAKRSDRIGSLVASLPLVTLVTLIWLYLEKQPASNSAIMPATLFGIYRSDAANVPGVTFCWR